LSRVKSPGIQAAHLVRSARRLVYAKRYVAALAAVDQAIFLAPSFAFYDYRGVLLCIMDKEQEALESFALALTLTTASADQAEIYFHRALLYGRVGSFDKALADLTRAQQLSPAHLAYREARASVAVEKERTLRKNPVSVCP
jgi:tetratricopeptide (TPR) repeat protein